VANDWLGRRSQPFAIRAPLARHGHVLSTFAPRASSIRKITRETRDAVTLELDTDVTFRPGQFLTLIVTIDGVEHRRAYSISTAPHDRRVAVTVKRMGLVSSYLCDRAREGERIQLLGPSGSFGVTIDPERARHVVLIGGGSGVTPLFSIARAVLHSEPASRVTLVLGNRTEQDIIFRDAIAAIDDPRFTVRHVLGPVLELPELPDGEHYLCGPEPMMVVVREALHARGVTEIHEEKFTSPTQRKSRLPIAQQPIRIGDATVIATPGQTILEAALQHQVALPYSCTMGGCGACKVRVVAGDVEMEEPSCLSSSERAAGYVLACVARAESPITIEVAK
jgi:ring-1,2-phenylacetyl-CoA epoxidase subunit PaaE